LSTGNITDRETWDYLKSVAPDLRGVRGDWDEVRSYSYSEDGVCELMRETGEMNRHRVYLLV